ncbi:MAG: hypothetical protein ACOYNF_12825 [Rhodoferax sp.]
MRQDQRLDLWLLPPWANRLLVLVRILLMALLVAHLAGFSPCLGRWRKLPGSAAAGSSILLAAILGGLPAGDAQAQMPDEKVLTQLKEKLSRPPDCLPDCAEITRLSLQASGSQLRLGLDVDAAIDTAVALPGGIKHWLPGDARLDGKTAHIQRDRSGGLWVLVPAGRHRVELSGELPARDTVQLPLPRKPRRVEISAADWEVSGLSEDTGAADNLQLTRRQKADSRGQAPALPTFLRVERRLVLDLNWRVETTVSRESPTDVPALAEIPLLAGEAVTSAGINVRDGKVLVNLGPDANAVQWTSTLEQKPVLTLLAPKQTAWAETWIIAATTIWHVAAEGIPPLAQDASAGAGLTFSPWPGETLRVAIDRPQAIPGQTLTIDNSTLVTTPGIRATDYQLALSVRSSLGSEHKISLPEGAVLQRVTINGQVRPIRANGRDLVLPVLPGEQRIDIAWRIDSGLSASFASIPASLNIASVNSHLKLHLPQDRWLLLAAGPGMGPAILFWGVLLVMLALSFLLGHCRNLPLKSWQWMLLALGLAQLSWAVSTIVVGWFFLIERRGRLPSENQARWLFNLRQIGLVLLTLAFLAILYGTVHDGLLGHPSMQVAGNQSSATVLNWFVDRSPAELGSVWVLSLPMLVWRGLMLAWSLWLAWSLLVWLKWGWTAFGQGGLWRKKPPKPIPPPEQVPAENAQAKEAGEMAG